MDFGRWGRGVWRVVVNGSESAGVVLRFFFGFREAVLVFARRRSERVVRFSGSADRRRGFESSAFV